MANTLLGLLTRVLSHVPLVSHSTDDSCPSTSQSCSVAHLAAVTAASSQAEVLSLCGLKIHSGAGNMCQERFQFIIFLCC